MQFDANVLDGSTQKQISIEENPIKALRAFAKNIDDKHIVGRLCFHGINGSQLAKLKKSIPLMLLP